MEAVGRTAADTTLLQREPVEGVPQAMFMVPRFNTPVTLPLRPMLRQPPSVRLFSRPSATGIQRRIFGGEGRAGFPTLPS